MSKMQTITTDQPKPGNFFVEIWHGPFSRSGWFRTKVMCMLRIKKFSKENEEEYLRIMGRKMMHSWSARITRYFNK